MMISNYKRLTLIIVLLSCVGSALAQKALPQLGRSTIKEVLAAMTLEEKAALVVGAGFDSPSEILPDGTVIGHTDVKVAGAAGNTFAIPRLGIPSMVLSDGPAGVRISPTRTGDRKTYYATAFPVGTLLASTWDTAVVKKVGLAFGNEVKEYGIDILLAPGVNIQRNPLNGRNFEYFSEDPLLAGTMAGAIINGIQANGVGTSIKHFVANNQETSRNFINAVISERALREMYLKPFRIGIAASNPWTVMSSYNKVNGIYTPERYDLLTTVLRDEWKFKGFVMSDWEGGRNWVAEMRAGNDLIMPGRPDQIKAILLALKHDSLRVQILDDNVARILAVIIKSPSFHQYKYSDKPDLKAHALIAREAAAEGMVLLENKNSALPIDRSVKRIAAFGNGSYNTIAGGMGSGDVNKAYVISVCDGLTKSGWQPNESLKNTYTDYLADFSVKQAGQLKDLPANSLARRRPAPAPELTFSDSMISQMATQCDLAIVTITRNAGEGADRNLETNYNLTAAEKEQIKKIGIAFHAKGKKVVTVINTTGVIDMKDWKDSADAILLAWQPGQEAGDAIADLLSGKVNPSGKLTVTFPMRYEDVPTANNFPGTPVSRPEQVVYEEGIYVGYRYYDSFKIKQQYEFGYGLSYSSFAYNSLKLSGSIAKGALTATIKVTNTSKVAGKEVVQLYVHAPAKTIDKPEQELRAFGKTHLLQPGETQVLNFVIHAADLASFHSATSEWIADAGNYLLRVGASSRNIKQSAAFALNKSIIVEKVHKVLQPQITINELKNN